MNETKEPTPLIQDAETIKAKNKKGESKAVQFFWLCVAIAFMLLSFWAAYGASLFTVPFAALAIIAQRVAYTERLSQIQTN